jgi:uncharacterized membrane protein YgcG
MRRSRVLGFLIVVLLLNLLAFGAAAQEKSLYWESYDVDITVLPNGDFRVSETQHLVFTSGTFQFGIRHIPTEFVSAISDVSVSEADGVIYQQSESGEPYTFRTYQSGDEFNIRYNFPPTADSDRVLVIEYTVSGGLLYYEGGDQLVWRAVPADPNIPIQNASVTVHLPPGALVTNYDATGPQGTATLIDDDQGVYFETTEPMRGGPDFAVRVQWPSGIVAGQPSAWQEEIDRADRIEPLADLGAMVLSLFFLAAGPLALYLLWYSKGRDAPVKLPAEWIPEPPSKLPSGMVGTLIDEQAETKDVLATLIDLARRGVLSIQEIKSEGFLGIGEKRDFIYRLEDQSLPMRAYEKLLVNKLFDDAEEKKLSELKDRFHQHIKSVQKGLYEATVEEGYFPTSPERIRTTYGILGVVGLVLAMVVGCFALITLGQYTGLAICVPVALAVPAIGLVILARFMPRKSEKGAEEAAKWLAFKRYMENIEKYTKVEEVKEIFDRYLPYAIAFGLEDSWIRKFAQVDTVPPPWYYPGPYYGPRPRRYIWWTPVPGGGRPPGQASPVPEGGDFSPPSMSDMSRGMGTSLASMSAGLGAMLTTASSTLTSRPAPQAGRGSWSAGGGSWSGGGGFSGGGWSGGGGFGGGGGGGSSFG